MGSRGVLAPGPGPPEPRRAMAAWHTTCYTLRVTKKESPAPGAFGALGQDIPAGVVVFLVALPLCLGIAHASGAPPIAGIVTGVVGGVLVAWLSGSHTSVSGPAAGLIVIVLAAAQDLGYGGLLLATVLAGAMQVAFGALRFGGLARLFPSSVVKGMLVAIGLILVLKQIPHALGWDADFEGDEAFAQLDGRNTFTEIPFALGHMHLGALIISVVGIALVIAEDQIAFLKRQAWLPGPLLAVAAGVGLNALFGAVAPQLAVNGHLLTAIPTGDLAMLRGELATPDFAMIGDPRVWMSAATIAIIASVETLLCVEAVDGLDPYRRKSPLDRELWAQGAGNIVAGFLGGIPMTAVIVRGSANVQAGARTRLSSFAHGAFLLVAVLAIPSVLNLIPLAALASILLFIGYRLARPGIFAAMFRRQSSHWVPFVVTVATILFTDLLIGVTVGFIVAAAFVVVEAVVLAPRRASNAVRVKLGPVVPYLSKLVLRRSLRDIPEGTVVEIDGSDADVVHDDLRQELEVLRKRAQTRNVEMHVNLPVVTAASH